MVLLQFLITLIIFAILTVAAVIIGNLVIVWGGIVVVQIYIVALRNEELHRRLREKMDKKEEDESND